jgi:hypothetical protein
MRTRAVTFKAKVDIGGILSLCDRASIGKEREKEKRFSEIERHF